MKKYISFALIALISGCASPNLQSDLLHKESADLQKVKQSCAETNKTVSHVAEMNCRFDGYEKVLGEAGFEEFNAFDILQAQDLNIAKQLDNKNISQDVAEKQFRQAGLEFEDAIRVRDRAKLHYSQEINAQNAEMVAIIAAGFSSGLQAAGNVYQARANAYGQAPSCPACQEGIAQGQAYAQQQEQEQQQAQQRQQMEAQQRQIQQHQQQIDRYNSESPVERLRYNAPQPIDNYGSYGSVPNQ